MKWKKRIKKIWKIGEKNESSLAKETTLNISVLRVLQISQAKNHKTLISNLYQMFYGYPTQNAVFLN